MLRIAAMLAVAVALAASGVSAQNGTACPPSASCFDCIQTTGCSYCAPASGSGSSTSCHATNDDSWWTANCERTGVDESDQKIVDGALLSACPASQGCGGEECGDCINQYCAWCFTDMSCGALNRRSSCSYNSSSSCTIPCGARQSCDGCLEGNGCEWCPGATPDDGSTGTCSPSSSAAASCQDSSYTCPIRTADASIAAPVALLAAAAVAQAAAN